MAIWQLIEQKVILQKVYGPKPRYVITYYVFVS